MRKADDYESFQDRVFQDINDLEELTSGWSSVLRQARIYGLSRNDIVRAYKKGMSQQELMAAMESIRKK